MRDAPKTTEQQDRWDKIAKSLSDFNFDKNGKCYISTPGDAADLTAEDLAIKILDSFRSKRFADAHPLHEFDQDQEDNPSEPTPAALADIVKKLHPKNGANFFNSTQQAIHTLDQLSRNSGITNILSLSLDWLHMVY